ncbi:MAG: phosphoribosyltransferase [Patescibacteria group bacterium]|jgi:putative phosphoribosyl transferase
MIFEDRTDAGKKLAERLAKYKEKNPALYALPRGGVEVAVPIAQKLAVPMDLIIARKVGHPLQPEFGIAAISEGGHLVTNPEMVATVDSEWFADEVARQQEIAKEKRQQYLSGLEVIQAEGRVAIIVDDGVATGLTLMATIQNLLDKKPLKTVVAIPVAPKDTAEKLAQMVDELVVLEVPKEFAGAVGAYYENFRQVSDEQVIELLNKVNQEI